MNFVRTFKCKSPGFDCNDCVAKSRKEIENKQSRFRDLTAARHLPLLMDRAYEGDETRQLVLSLGMIPIVPPKSNRIEPWEYDRALYKKRNEIERLFRRLKGFRRIFTRFEKLDVLFQLRPHHRRASLV
jgi:transposase